uniref:Inositol hexakisphosphate and diphosphoinositol-pentakisphosphate kinase n=1 Tax=Phallusia mammillata TaxID=59560 RepID=A0A6F9DF52_9ASCI|nr:inositol hexakisphosphate and diphosphoinositol-pentakisphosphate kinase 2 [Phallusia mammillata]
MFMLFWMRYICFLLLSDVNCCATVCIIILLISRLCCVLSEKVKMDKVEEEFMQSEDTNRRSTQDQKQIIVGICAMAKKTKSKPMQEILNRLDMFEYISIDVFDESVILNSPVSEWPHCDCLISFHSTDLGFPLQKALEYTELRQPFLINDLQAQFNLQDRRIVYKMLQQNGIETPRYAVCDRSSGKGCHFEEYEDHIVVGNEVFHKPFVEKPVDAEDHNIHIYYPSSAGGGCQKLFRKIGNRSSQYSTQSCVRRAGSYLYEDFMPTDGTDVKVYTVGADYAHAEARKSPALDGKVERDSEGKEVRFPVILSAKEKLIARQVCLAFKQTVCGFDFLRAHGKSFVCDVNGFSFVKNSMKYYDDCAKVLGNIIMRDLAPQFHIPWSITTDAEDIPIVPTTSGTMMELRCVIAVVRHGDRTPKQKMKMEVRHQKFFDLFTKYNGHKTGKLKLKRPKQLQEVLDVARSLLADSDTIVKEKLNKLEQLKSVLEMYGHFSGINRKVQFKYLSTRTMTSSSEDDLQCYSGPSLLLILKWGGELTPAGRRQAEELGQAFRCMYPGGQGDYAGFPGCGLLRLHSTYRHDLKIYASDEGRVQMTAAAFAKGLLALEGELTPILVQMVKSANMNGLLDNEGDNLSDCQQKVKAKLQDLLNKRATLTDDDFKQIVPLQSSSVLKAIRFVGNPNEKCTKIYNHMQSLTSQMKKLLSQKDKGMHSLYHNESLEIMLQRWAKLERDFKMKNGSFDISKIPDIYDCIKYDLQHNRNLGLDKSIDLYRDSKSLADVVIPQEYGISRNEKLEIALGYCVPLLRKMRVDLQRNLDEDTYRLNPRYSRGVLSPGRHVRTRLYFTSESHIHSLLTVLQYGGLCNEKEDSQWKGAMEYVDAVSELNYMTQIVIMLYEDPNEDPQSEKRFHIELHFSAGAKGNQPEEDFPQGGGFRPGSKPPSRAHSPVTKSPERKQDANDNLKSEDKKRPLFYTDSEEEESDEDDVINDDGGDEDEDEDLKNTSNAVRAFLRTSKPHRSAPPPAVHIRQPEQSRKYSARTLRPQANDDHYAMNPLRPYEFKGGLGSRSKLFSNRVLTSASASASFPNLNKKKNTPKIDSAEDTNEASASSIRPLETLHNSLSLKQMNDFLDKVVLMDIQNSSTETNMAAPTHEPSFNAFVPMKVRPNEYEAVGVEVEEVKKTN